MHLRVVGLRLEGNLVNKRFQQLNSLQSCVNYDGMGKAPPNNALDNNWPTGDQADLVSLPGKCGIV